MYLEAPESCLMLNIFSATAPHFLTIKLIVESDAKVLANCHERG